MTKMTDDDTTLPTEPTDNDGNEVGVESSPPPKKRQKRKRETAEQAERRREKMQVKSARKRKPPKRKHTRGKILRIPGQPKGTPGRKPLMWLPYDELVALLRAEGIRSVIHYRRWWDINRPAKIPKYPHRIRQYRDDFTSYANLLGSTGKFGEYVQKKWRPYPEFVAAVRAKGIKTMHEYRRWTKEPDFPDDLPVLPECCFRYDKEWMGWSVVTGKKVTHVVETAKMIEATKILVVASVPGVPPNVLFIEVIPGGATAVDRAVRAKEMVPLKLFEVDPSRPWKRIIDTMTSEWWEDPKLKTVNNVSQLLWELSSELLIVTP